MKLNDDQIRDYWRSQAITFGEDHKASWTDGYAINLEIEAISIVIDDGQPPADGPPKLPTLSNRSTTRVASPGVVVGI